MSRARVRARRRDARTARRLLPWLVLGALLGAGRGRSPVISWFEPALPTTMHPLYPSSEVDLRAHALVYDRLFVHSPLEGGLSSRVVDTFTTADGVVRLRLKPSIRWHDGARLTARDVCFTVDRLRDPASTSPIALRSRQRLRRCAVDPADPLSAEITLTRRPSPDPRAVLDFPLIPAHLAPDGPDHPLSTAPVGTGPMRAQFDGRSWRFTAHRNPHHRPSLTQLRLEVAPHPDLAVDTLLRGGVRGLVEVPPSRLDDVRAADGVDLHHFPKRQWWALAVNATSGPLGDPRIREALDLLLDREALRAATIGVDAREEQPATLVSGPFPPGSRSSNRAVAPTRPDPERAAALLQDAGLVRIDGRWHADDQPITLRIGAPATLPGADRALSTLAAQWEGFGVQPVVLDPAAMRATLAGARAGDLDLLLNAWQVAYDPATALVLGPDDLDAVLGSRTATSGAFNVFGHADPELDRLLDEAASADPADRAVLHRALHARLADSRAHLSLWHLEAWSAWRSDLGPVVIAPVHYFTDIDAWGLR